MRYTCESSMSGRIVPRALIKEAPYNDHGVITPRQTSALRRRVRHVTTEHGSCDLQTALLESAPLLCCSVCSAALLIQSRVQERTSLLGI
jgi:hypothetical protein